MRSLANHPPVLKDFAKSCLLCSSFQSCKSCTGSELNGEKGPYCYAGDMSQARPLARAHNQQDLLVHNQQDYRKRSRGNPRISWAGASMATLPHSHSWAFFTENPVLWHLPSPSPCGNGKWGYP